MSSIDFTFDPVQQVQARWKRVVVAIVIVTSCAVVYAFATPRWYSAHLSIVPTPPKSPGSTSLLGGAAGGALAGALDLADLGMGSMDAERAATVFKSTQVSDSVISDHDLLRRYREDYIEDAREDLWDHCSVKVEKKSGVVTLTCEDKSPDVVRAMLASFGKYANESFIRISTSSAGAERRFLEQRVAQARGDLDTASAGWRKFAEQNKVVDIEAQARAVVEMMARLNGELIAKQMELSFLERFAAGGESNTAQVASQIAILQSRLASLETGQGTGADKQPRPTKPGSSASSDHGIFPLAASMPRLQVELTQQYRELKTQETVFLFLTQMYEMARVNEARSTPAFQMLDPPFLPVKHARPKRLLLGFAGMLLGTIVGISWAIGGAWWRSTRRRSGRRITDDVVGMSTSVRPGGGGGQ